MIIKRHITTFFFCKEHFYKKLETENSLKNKEFIRLEILSDIKRDGQKSIQNSLQGTHKEI